MTTLETIRAALAPDLLRLSDRIAECLHTDNPMLQGIVSNSLRSKGKLIRPIIVILSARLMGEVTDMVIDSAAAVELLHNASLVHDDVVDGSMTRRGKPTVNAVWDNHVAVLVGDFFVSSSMQLAINTGSVKIVEAVCTLGRNLSLGELDQIYNAFHHSLTEESYFRIITFKTASLFMACSRMGSYAQGIDDERTERLSEFTRLLGLCFQMRDDIFDYYNDPAVGKPTGNDLREGKVTLPRLHVLLDDSLPQHDEMLQLSRKEMLSDAEIQRLYAYAVENGGIEYTYRRMAEMRSQAERLLDIFPDSDSKRMLLGIFDFIIARSY